MKMKSNLLILTLVVCGLVIPGLGLTTSRGAMVPPGGGNGSTPPGGGQCPNCPTIGPSNPNDKPPDDDKKDNDPISLATGAMTVAMTDLVIPGPLPIKFTRYYSSKLDYDGPIGYAWDNSFNKFLNYSAPSGGGYGTLYYHTGRGVAVPLPFSSQPQSDAKSSVGAEYTASYDSTNNRYVITDRSGTKDLFDSNGLIEKTIDRNGNELDYTKDTNGNVIKVEDPVSGAYITLSLDGHSRISSITDSFGRTVSYTYDSNYCLTQVTEPGTPDFPSGTTRGFGYDSHKRMTSKIDGNANTYVTNTYGTWGGADQFKIASQTWNGGTTTYSWDDTNHKVTRTDALGYVSEYYNDGGNNITKEIIHTAGLHSGEPSTYETDYSYDSNKRKTLQTNPRGNTIAWTYDSNGNVLTITKSAPSGTTVDSTKGTQSLTSLTTFTYESRFNQVASMTDPNGNVTTYDYGNATTNPSGNLLTVTYPTVTAGTATETYTYNSKGQVLTDTTSDGVTKYAYDATTGYRTQMIQDYGSGKLNATTNYTYDTYGNVASIQDPNGNTISKTYNAQDQLIEVDGANSQVETITYDANEKYATDVRNAPSSGVEKTTYIYNSYLELTAKREYTGTSTYVATTYAYDAEGNRTQITDPLSHTTYMAYDERYFPYKETDPLGNITKCDYDANGNISSLTDELSHTSTYAYDGLDRLEQKTYPGSSYETWKYDAEGNITGFRTTAGNTISQTYNARNWKLTQNYGSTITNTFDLMGRLLTSTEGGTSLTYVYDALGRNTSFTDQAGLTSTYTYDLDGNRLNSNYPTSVTFKRAYDASDRLYTIKDGSNNTLVTYTSDILNRASSIAYANSTTVTIGFDLLNRVSSLADGLTSGTRTYSYVYNDANQATSITEPRGAIAIGYDYRNEVTGVTEPSGSPFADESFTYDAGFNRSTWTLGSTTTSYTANSLNQYTAVGSATPTWNSDGSLATFSGNTYTYDALKRLTEVDYTGGKSLFTYDPMGRRVKKVDENGSGTVLATYTYHYDGAKLAVEYRPSSTTWTYCYGVDNNDVLLRINGSTKQWYYRNGLDDISAVADNSGALTEGYEYNVQGQFQITNGSGTVLSSTGIGNDILYTGQLYDPETTNYYYRARYYNPQLGRFISRDPLSGAEFSQGTNLYAYVKNNPVNMTDPTGTEWQFFAVAALIAIYMYSVGHNQSNPDSNDQPDGADWDAEW